MLISSAKLYSHALQKQSKGGIGGWPFHREGTGSYPKSADAHATNQNATQTTARAAPPVMRNDTSEYIPRVVSIRAGEGPADNVQETSARRAMPPTTVTPAARDSTVHPLPTVQVLQQPQTFDRQPRAVPRAAASAQLEPPGHASAAHIISPQPWLQSAQWSTEPQPMSPVPPVPQPMSPALHPMPPTLHPMSPTSHPMSPTSYPMSPTLHPMSPAPRPVVVPSPVVFPASLAPPPAVVETHRQAVSNRLHHVPPTQEGPSHTQAPQEIPWPNNTANSRPPAPTVPSQSVPSPMVTNSQRVLPQVTTSAVPDAGGTKPPRHRSIPGGYGDPPSARVAPPPSRPIAADLAAAFPIREDNVEVYHRYSPQEERAQETRASRNIPDQWDRHGYTQESVARLVVSTVPSSERTPRSTKASPNLHPRLVNQGTPPKAPLPPILAPTYQPQSSTNPDLLQAHDISQPGTQNLNSSAYPATSIYPSSSPRTHVEASPAMINNPSVANGSPNNPSPKVKPGNPSPRSRSQAVAPSQGPPHPVAVHITNRTPSHETGSTTLLGQTPSSQGSMLLVPMSPTPQPQVMVRVGNHGGQQSVHTPVPVPDILGDRNSHAITHTPANPAARQTPSRHHHSSSAPTIPVSSLTQPPPVRSQTQPTLRVPPTVSPMPVRPYPTMQAAGDPYTGRHPVSGYPSTPAPNFRQMRHAVPSPSQESELNTPSSLAVSTKLPIVSDEPIAPVMSTQSYQEPKKKNGFFHGLFRSKSSAQKQHPHEAKMVDASSRGQLPPVKFAPPKQYDSDSKVGMAPSKLKKAKTPGATHPPVSTSVSQPPLSQPQPPSTPMPMAPPPTPMPMAPPPTPFTRMSTAPNAFTSFRVVSKRHRTMSGASAEAVDGTNAGVRLPVSVPQQS